MQAKQINIITQKKYQAHINIFPTDWAFYIVRLFEYCVWEKVCIYIWNRNLNKFLLSIEKVKGILRADMVHG